MKGKMLFAVGLGVGYVLGTRAGRKRYEQMKAAADKIWQSPGIQRQVHAAQDYAAARIGDIPGAVFSGVGKVVSGAVGRRQAQRAARAKPDVVAETAED